MVLGKWKNWPKAIEPDDKRQENSNDKKWEKVIAGIGLGKRYKDWCISRQIWWGHKIPLDGIDDVSTLGFVGFAPSFATLGWA